jgi:hypothetical protein
MAHQAGKMGLSMGQFIRHSVEQALTGTDQTSVGTLFDLGVYRGPGPKDVSAHVDEYLYGEKK